MKMNRIPATNKPNTNQRAQRDLKPLIDSKTRDPKVFEITTEVSAILSTAICRLIQTCDRQSVPIASVIDKSWIEHFITKYNMLTQLEANI